MSLWCIVGRIIVPVETIAYLTIIFNIISLVLQYIVTSHVRNEVHEADQQADDHHLLAFVCQQAGLRTKEIKK